MARENSSIRPTLRAAAISASDDDALGYVTRGLYVGASGNVTYIPEGQDTTVLLVGLAAGIIHPIAAKHIKATGTGASSIVGFYDPDDLQV